MKRQLRICSCCKQEYKYCPKCSAKDREKPLWYFSFCSENCKKIFDIASEFEIGHITPQEAYNALSVLDLGRFEYFGTSYKESILKINNVELKKAEQEDISQEKCREVHSKIVKKNKKEKDATLQVVCEKNSEQE